MHEARLDGNGTPGGGAKRYKRNAHNQRTTATLNSRTANVGGRQTGAHNGPTNWARKWWANGIDDANTPESKYSISPICSMCSISSMCSIRSMCCARLLELGPYYSLCYLVTHTNTLLRTRCQSCTHSRNNSHCNNSHYSGIRLLHNLHIFHVLASSGLITNIHTLHSRSHPAHSHTAHTQRDIWRNTQHTVLTTTQEPLAHALPNVASFSGDLPLHLFCNRPASSRLPSYRRRGEDRRVTAHREHTSLLRTSCERGRRSVLIPSVGYVANRFTTSHNRSRDHAIRHQHVSICRLSQTSSCPSPRLRRPHANERNRYHTMLHYRRACHNGITTYSDDNIG